MRKPKQSVQPSKQLKQPKGGEWYVVSWGLEITDYRTPVWDVR